MKGQGFGHPEYQAEYQYPKGNLSLMIEYPLTRFSNILGNWYQNHHCHQKSGNSQVDSFFLIGFVQLLIPLPF